VRGIVIPGAGSVEDNSNLRGQLSKARALGYYSSPHARNNLDRKRLWITEDRFVNVLRSCIKYFTLQGMEDSEKMWQFAKGKGYEDHGLRHTYYFDSFITHI